MNNIEITTFKPTFGDAIEKLQQRYIAANPQGTKFVPKDLYQYMPALDGGRNVICAFEQEELVGYGVLHPAPADPTSSKDIPNMIWIYIRFEPDRFDLLNIQIAIYERILQKSREYASTWEGRKTRIGISYPETRTDEIAFFAEMGFQHFDTLLQLRRDLSTRIPDVVIPAGITIQRWPLTTDQEKLKYISAATLAFPQAPQSLADLDFYIDSWKGGLPIIAFDGMGEIAGGLMAFWYREDIGITEDIFVLSQWRRKGIARCLIGEGIRYLRENDIHTAWLEVKESNLPAVKLYETMGYIIANREEQWEKTV